jgi:aminodeoxyfutalosine deaminase
MASQELPLPVSIATVPKAELHLHLEGSIQPATACALAARHRVALSEQEVRSRYAYRNFTEFIEAFKWVTSFLREPQDYALLVTSLGEQLLEQNVVYAEVMLSVGIMLLRGQQPAANFDAILRAAEPFSERGLYLRWIFDAVRQFGPEKAMLVVEAAARHGSKHIVAFGIGGDELSVPTAAFRPVYDRAAEFGLHRLIHAGEIGGPEKIREAIDLLGVERIGHGIAAIQDGELMDKLAGRQIPLEVCPTSNLRTGALARLLGETPGTSSATEDLLLPRHPLTRLFRHNIPIALSTDDPSMFHTTLGHEYAAAHSLGLTEEDLRTIVAHSFRHAYDCPSHVFT